MYNNIMVPVDLGHTKTLGRALETAADLAKHYGEKVTYVGVTSSAPGSVANSPEDYQAKLGEFAKSQADAHNVKTAAHSAVSHDPSVDLDPTLLKAAATIEADLIVMQSHIPGLADHLWPSNGGKIARQAKCSVMIVRD